jgi:hypothetical protein
MEDILYSYKKVEDKKYLTVGEMKELLNELDNDDNLVVVSSGGDFFIINEMFVDEENDLLIKADTRY